MSLTDKRCVPCRPGTPPLAQGEIDRLHLELASGWEVAGGRLRRHYDFPDFKSALAFTVRGSANRSRFVLAGCNVTGAATDVTDVGFRYVVIDLP